MDRLADFRAVFAEMVVARAGCPTSEPLRRAFARVPRHDFLGPGPWIVLEDGTRTASADPALVYQDVGIGLAPGIPNGLPSLHASLLHAAHPEPGERVMHVGAGTGYYTAILAELVGPSGHVIGYEIDEALAARAREQLSPWPWITIEARSGAVAPERPVDLVYVNAGVQQLPRAWLDGLSARGRMVVPLAARGGHGAVFLVERSGAARCVCRAQFVPCIGTEDERAAAALEEALRTGALDSFRSLDELSGVLVFAP